MLRELLVTPRNDQTDSIFQVTINSKKLMLLLNKLEDNHTMLNNKVQTIQEHVESEKKNLNDKFLSIQLNCQSLVQQQIERIKIELQNNQKKLQSRQLLHFKEQESKITELNYSIQTLNDKINKVNSNLTSEFQKSFQNLEKSILTFQSKNEKSQQIFQTALCNLFQKLESQKVQLTSNIQKIDNFEGKLNIYVNKVQQMQGSVQKQILENKHRDSNQKCSELLQNQSGGSSPTQKVSQRHKNKQSPKNSTTKKSLFSHTITSQKKNQNFLFKKDFQQNNINSQNYLQTLQYASIAAKVQNLEKKIGQKNQQPKQTSARESNFKSIMKGFNYFKDSFGSPVMRESKDCFYNENIQQFELLKNIFGKLQKIENLVSNKQKDLKKSIEELQNKELANTQKISFLKQKIHKIKPEVSEIKLKLTLFQKKTGLQNNYKILSDIEDEIAKITFRIDKQSDRKLESEQFEKEKGKFGDKFTCIEQALGDKADKAQVRKAVTFLEDKIKEIILILANDNQSKLGKVNNQAAKCLVCDKYTLELDNRANTTALKKVPSKSTRDFIYRCSRKMVKSRKEGRDSTKGLNRTYVVVTQTNQQKDPAHISYS